MSGKIYTKRNDKFLFLTKTETKNTQKSLTENQKMK